MRRAALLVTMLAIALAGCGGSETESAAPETVEGTVPQETAPAGGGGEGDPEAGADIFASAGCGSCHTYEPAGSSGTAGPNLDVSDVD